MFNFLIVLIKILSLIIVIVSYGCSNHEYFYGNRIGEENLKKITIGETSFDEFKEMFGEPSFTSTFDQNIFYSYEHVSVPPGGKKEFIVRELVTLKVDENNKIKDLEFSDITDKKIIKPIEGKSIVKGSNLSFLGQLLNNLRSGSFIQ